MNYKKWFPDVVIESTEVRDSSVIMTFRTTRWLVWRVKLAAVIAVLRAPLIKRRENHDN